jgi:hypothetical protein
LSYLDAYPPFAPHRCRRRRQRQGRTKRCNHRCKTKITVTTRHPRPRAPPRGFGGFPPARAIARAPMAAAAKTDDDDGVVCCARLPRLPSFLCFVLLSLLVSPSSFPLSSLRYLSVRL